MRAGLAMVCATMLVAGSAAQAAEKKTPDQCVTSPVVDTRIIDDNTLLVMDRDGHAALLTLTGPCLQDRSAPFEIKYNTGAGNRICRPADADITSGRSVPLTCGIKHMEPISHDEALKRLH